MCICILLSSLSSSLASCCCVCPAQGRENRSSTQIVSQAGASCKVPKMNLLSHLKRLDAHTPKFCGSVRVCGINEDERCGVSLGDSGLYHQDSPVARLSWGQLPNTIAQTTIATDMNLLKQSTRELQVRVNQLKKSSHRACDIQDLCYVYMRPYHLSLNQVTTVFLKMKIPKSGLYTAL